MLNWAEVNNVGYGYALRKIEAHKITRDTMPTWINSYIKSRNIKPLEKNSNMSFCYNFYNNFHLGNVHFFKRRQVQQFLKSIHDSGYIQKHRWGDSTIEAYAVRIFMPPQHIKVVPDFSYWHGSHNNFISTFNNGSQTTLKDRLPWDFDL